MPEPQPQVDQMLNEYSHAADIVASTQGWEKPDLFIVEKAIVIAVKTGVNLSSLNSSMIPQFSVNARVLGENSSFSMNPKNDIPDWYPPLFPNTIVSVPEVGEVVIILKENTAQSNKGWWIGRSPDSDQVSLKLAGSQFITRDRNPLPMEKYGLPFDVAGVNKQSNQPSSFDHKPRWQIPARLGDVFIQGRSGSFLRNSYNPNYGPLDKPGVLELGILKDKIYGAAKTPSVGVTETKTIHLNNARPSDLGPRTTKVTVNDIDKVPVDNKGGFMERRTNIIANLAGDIYNISTARDAQPKLHKQVLGEKLNSYLEEQDILLSDVMQTLKGMAHTMQMLFDSYMNHTHVIPEINIDIPDKEVEVKDVINKGIAFEPREPVRVFVPAQEVSVPPSGGRTVSVTVDTPVGPKVITEEGAGSPGGTVTIPSKFVNVPQPDRPVNLGYRTETTTKTIEFEKITIGGNAAPRMTTTISSDRVTSRIQTDVNELDDKFREAKNNFIRLIDKLSDNLSKRQYIN